MNRSNGAQGGVSFSATGLSKGGPGAEREEAGECNQTGWQGRQGPEHTGPGVSHEIRGHYLWISSAQDPFSLLSGNDTVLYPWATNLPTMRLGEIWSALRVSTC